MKNIDKHIYQTACALLILICGLAPIRELFGQTVQVTENVVSGTEVYASNDTIIATNQVESNAEMILKAGERVFLKDYFYAKAGSRLSASTYAFFAQDNQSDEHIDLYWSIETQCLWDDLNADPLLPAELHGNLVYVEISRNGQEVYHQILTDKDLDSAPRFYGRLYSHPESDDVTVNYQMKLYAIGSGTLLCDGSFQDDGNTLPFQPLTNVIAQDNVSPGEVAISWTNNSDLPTHYRIYRDGEIIAIVDGTDSVYNDHYQANDPNTLANGTQYQYCVEVFNDRLQKAYTQSCDNGSTVALALVASDQAYPDKVELTWNDASAYADELTITRDGETIATLTDETITTYTDIRPVHGKVHQYGVVLKKTAEVQGAAFDAGGIAANGLIAGRIVTNQGDYALEGVAIRAIAIIEGTADTLDAVADHAGYFAFENIYYHEEATYTLTAMLQGHTFMQPVQEVTLTRDLPEATAVEFKGEHLFTVDNAINFTFANLSIAAQPAQDRVALTWTYTKPGNNDIVYFRVYRNGERIAFLDDSQGSITAFEDITGVPGADYNYEVKAYIKLSDEQVMEIVQEGQQAFPNMALPQLVATADANLGLINLSWSHTSQNFEQYQLLRDNKQISILAVNETAYVDYAGVPGQEHTYQLLTVATREGLKHYSDTATSLATYPELNTVTLANNNFTSNPDGTLHFTFPEAHPGSYNFDGYRIYRDNALIHTVYKGFPREYTDRTGSGSTSYTYKVAAFLENADVITEGGFTGYMAGYPDITTPTNLTASQHTTEGVVNLTWSYTSAYADGFVVYRGQDSVAVLPTETRSYRDAINFNYAPNTDFDYTLKAYTLREGVVSYSGAAYAIGGPDIATSQGSAPPIPEGFAASNDLHNQVRLQWEYPNYVKAKFIVYRDGVELTTLDTDQRLYYDYTAVQGMKYVYAVMADYEDPQQPNTPHQSQKALAEGGITSLHTLSGIITSEETGYGLAGVPVVAGKNGTGLGYATTDDSGFYRFEEVPEGSIDVAVQAPFAATIANNGQTTVQVSNVLENYRHDFVSSLGYEKPADTIAMPVVQATPNAVDATVEVRWTTRSANYSGFKVYRGLTELADVKAEEEKLVIDSLGYPGQDYSYRIQAYWTNPQEVYSKSQFVYDHVFFPKIAPVQALEVTRFAARDYAEITWSHPYDQHTYYEVNRNDQLLGIVNTGNLLVLKDTIGLPGQNYNYTVTAVEVRNGQLLRSKPVSREVQFPAVAMPADIMANVPVNENHVALTWKYPSQLFEGFRVYRDDALIADTVIHAPYPQDVTYQYYDSLGVPGMEHTYKVMGYAYKQGTRYESAPDQITTTFPALAPVQNEVATPQHDEGTVSLSWSYPAPAQNGYRIQRDGADLAMLTNPVATSYTDMSGVPGQQYTYSIIAYAKRGTNQTEYQSAIVNVNSTYPLVSAPANLTASDGTDANAIDVQWTYTSAINDGFILYCDDQAVETLSAGIRSYRDVFDTQANHTYKVKAIRQVDGVEYASPESNPDAGSNAYNSLGTDNVAAATNVQATDGTLANKVKIEWSYNGNNPERFDMYRDGVLIDNTNGNSRIYNDIDAIPGKQHLYQIVAVDAQQESRRRGDTGYRPGNGAIQGMVVALENGAAVPGIPIVASGWVNGNRYDYRDTTDVEGNYELTQVYYGATQADYQVVAAFPGHDFVEDTLQTSLDVQINVGYVDSFQDKTAYILRGNMTYLGGTCAVPDSTKIVLQTRLEDGSQDGTIMENEAYTNAQGEYAFVVNPNDPTLLDYTLMIANRQGDGMNVNADTVWHHFGDDVLWEGKTGRKVIIDKASITQTVTEQDFTDSTSYPVELVVQSTCGPIGTNRFDIRVSSVDGCFEQQYRTQDNGKLMVNLPPLSYTLHVSGIVNASPETLSIVDYLRVRPATLDLFTLHNKTLQGDASLLQEELQIVFTYHKAPQITVNGDNLNYLCDDPANPMVIKQGDVYTLQLSATEQHGGESCPVNEGFLVIKNAADKHTAPDTLVYDKVSGEFPSYTFTGGDPITIDPYVLGMVVEYHTENGGYQGEKIQQIIVEGEKSPPGNDIIVSMEEAQIQLPLFILRDPPGDQSYSYIEEGVTFEKMLTVSDMNSGGAGVKGEFQLSSPVAGSGFFVEGSAKLGGGNGQSASFGVSVTTTDRIETSGDATLEHNYITGDQGDVIVGAGLSTAYGLTEKIEINENCQITKSTAIRLAPNGLSTSWHYSVFQIEKLVEEYGKQLQAIEEGTLEIEGLENGQDAADYISTLKSNWEELLQYHRTETVPMCQVCDISTLPDPFKNVVQNMPVYKTFCNELGGVGKCDLTQFTWTNDLMDQYNTLSQFKVDLQDYIAYGYVDGLALNNNSDDRLVITEAILQNVDLNGEYEQLHGPDVTNITFDGATGAISREVTITKSKSRGVTQKTYVNIEAFAGLLIKKKIKIATGLPILLKVSVPLEMESKIGLTGEYNFEFERSKENTEETSATVGYVLDDDDDGDQYSVTVVKGIDPSHTPYFSLLGGRSSCPYEEGTISRFDPQLFVELPDGSVTKEATLWDVDPEGPASFRLKMASGNLFGENLQHYLYAPTELAPNQNDAEIFLQIGGENDGTGTRFIAPGVPQYTQVDIMRREGDVYDYEDIMLALSPKCEENYNTVADYVTLKVHFKRPCSPVSLLVAGNRDLFGSGTTDGDRWVINKAPQNEQEQLFLKLVDYDPENVPLEDITLQYRRLSSNNWFDIETIEKGMLADYYEANIATYPNPTYPYVWDITDLDLTDGEYEVRALSACGTSGENYSNVLTGVIDRTSLQVFGTPEPADGILSLGDEISITFNEMIDCALFDPTDVSLVNASNNNSAVGFTVSCLENRLALVVTDDLSLLEGYTLVATVDDVVDAYGNNLENLISWSFAVHHNPVYWYPNSLSVQVLQGETATLIGQLHNTSAADLAFALSGHELAWLDAGIVQGSIPPSGMPIDFTIDAATMDIGSYEVVIDANIEGFTSEALTLHVDVYPESPDWSVDPSAYEGNMTMAANFNLDNTSLSTDTLDMISAWIGNELRGVANVSKVTENDHVAYLNIGGNSGDEGKELSFLVWDASTGAQYEGHPGQAYTYGKGDHYGTTTNPVILTADSNVDSVRYVSLKAGWNWLSFNTEQNDMSVSTMLKGLNASENDLIKTQNSTSTYSAQNGWQSLDGLNSLDTESGYHLYLAEEAILRLTGTDATITSQVLIQGWNLIGYQPQQPQTVDEALVDFTATAGDIIKTEYGFAEYSANPEGWFGLDRLKPNKAYMIEVSEPKTLQYSGRNENGENMVMYIGDWSVDPAQFEHNMTMIGTLDFEGVNPEDMGIIAFVGEEPRGIGRFTYHAATDKQLVSLFVYADNEEVHFKLIDKVTGDLYELANTETFKTNARFGSIADPYVFTHSMNSSSAMVRVAPNPFVNKTVITYTVPNNDIPVTIQVYDLSGVLVTELMKDEVHQAGKHEATLTSGELLKPGMYVCKLRIGEEVISRKIILQK